MSVGAVLDGADFLRDALAAAGAAGVGPAEAVFRVLGCGLKPPGPVRAGEQSEGTSGRGLGIHGYTMYE